MSKLIVAWIVENDEDVWNMSADSVKDVADVMLVIDGNAEKKDRYFAPEGFKGEFIVIHYPYKHEYKGANGHQRKQYLNYLKEHYLNEWCLVLDADEVVDKPEEIKKSTDYMVENNYSTAYVLMRHFVYNLAMEDNTQNVHYVPLRLFKTSVHMDYPEVEHPVLQGFSQTGRTGVINNFCIWHLAYAREMVRLKNKYLNHLEKSNMHTPLYLTKWYHAHMFAQYPIKMIPFKEFPAILKKHFLVNDDYMYFKDRNLETKHFMDAVTWKEYFNPVSALEVGCGMAHRVHAMDSVGIEAYGFELSQWAVDNCPYSTLVSKNRIKQGDVLYQGAGIGGVPGNCRFAYDLVVVYDVLEHIEEKDLQTALANIRSWTKKNALFSIPFDTDPNLYNDDTHKIFKSKEWWLGELAKAGFRAIPTPDSFLYPMQLIVCEVYDR